MISLATHFPKQNPRTTARTFEDETVIVDPTTNIARMLNSVGSRIWELADGNHSVEQIVQQIQTEYAVSSSEASARN